LIKLGIRHNFKNGADYLFKEFYDSEYSKLSLDLQRGDFKDKFQDLKDNFSSKISNFKDNLKDKRLLRDYIQRDEGQLLLKFICQLNHQNFENILKRDFSDSEQISEQITSINSFIRGLGSPITFHKLKGDLITIAQDISKKTPGISPEKPVQVVGQESVYSR
jgi:hypothetical protein